MAATNKFRFRNLVLFTTLPAILIGALLWVVAGLLPSCQTLETDRLTAPDARFDLVIFSRSCGPETGANTQAALIPTGDALPEDVTSFLSIGAQADLAPRWDSSDKIELTIPDATRIYRQDDTVAGIAVRYR